MSLMNKAASSLLVFGLILGLAGCGSETKDVVLSPGQEKAVSERLAPDGQVVLESEVASAGPSAAAAGGEPRPAEEIYNKSCMSCHMTGAAGAPKLGDVAAWAPRLEQGIDTLYTHAIQGIRGMPPKGLCMDCSDEELEHTVDYIIANSQ